MAADTNKFLLIFAILLTIVVLFQQRANLSSVISEKLELETRLTRHFEEDESDGEKNQQHVAEIEKWQAKAAELESENRELESKKQELESHHHELEEKFKLQTQIQKQEAFEPEGYKNPEDEEVDMEGLKTRLDERKRLYEETCKEFLEKKPAGRWFKTNTVLSVLGPDRIKNNTKWEYYMSYFDYERSSDLVLCAAPKTATTNWKKALIALVHKNYYGADKPMTIQKVEKELNWQTVFSLTGKMLKEEKKHGRIFNAVHDEKMHKIINVRHPLKRMHSAWKDKFTKLNNIEHDITTGSVFNYYDNSIRTYGNETLFPTPKNARVSFYAFANFVASDSKSNAHWRPIWQVCWPCLIDYDYISKTETLGSDSRYIFDKLGIQDMGYFPSAYENHNSTMNYIRKIYEDFPQELLDRLYKYYYWDFKLFGYGKIQSKRRK